MNDLNEELRKIAAKKTVEYIDADDSGESLHDIILAAIHEGVKLVLEREPSAKMKIEFNDDRHLKFIHSYRAMTAQLIKELGGQ